MMNKSLWFKIITASILCLGVGGLSGFATSDAIGGWYATLNKPSFNPPGWVFGPVWSVLYILMGISAGMIWNEGIAKPNVKKALIVFGIHMVLNGAWSIIFFGLKQPTWAFFEILILFASMIYFTRLFYGIKPRAAWLQIPYLLWVSFASVLNATIAWMN